MSKIVLLSINAKYIHSSLSVWFLSEGVSRYAKLNHDVKIVEATIKQENDEIIERIIFHKPDVIGISTYIWNINKLQNILELIKKQLPDIIFVLGGPEASNNAEYWLKHNADYVICGAGERSFPALLDALEVSDATALKLIPGLCRKQNNEIISNLIINQPDELIDPYSEIYFETLNGRITYIETSRGCPFDCSFCLSGSSGVKYSSLDVAKEQLYKLINSGTKTIKFVDRTFNCNIKRAYKLFEFVINLKTTCCFHFEVAADLFDDKTLFLLKTAPPGRIQFEIGLQSFNEPTLKTVSRKTDIEKVVINIRTLLNLKNIHIHIDLIAGLPHETLSDFQNSFKQAYALNAHTLQLGFLKLLHGSKLREQAKNLGIVYSKEPPYEIISNTWLSVDDLNIIKQVENSLQHTYNKGRFLSVLEYILSATSLHPFLFYYEMGKKAPNHGTFLDVYAKQIFDFCKELPNVNEEKLRDYMICDWLSMVKGKNMPHFLKRYDKRRKQIAIEAKNILGHTIDYDEVMILSSDKGVFVDSADCNPVTGLYKLHYLKL